MFIAVLLTTAKDGNNLNAIDREMDQENEIYLVVQWLRLGASNARGMSSIPGKGLKIPSACLVDKKAKLKAEAIL